MSPRRTIALALVTIVMVGTLGACRGGGDPSPEELAARDQRARIETRLAVAQSQGTTLQRLKAERVARAQRNRHFRALTLALRRAVQSRGIPVDELCVRVRAGRGVQRLAQLRREERRRQALYELNLSCPAS